jgi:3-phosphoshikimate 1-carboxyvinyltransferase
LNVTISPCRTISGEITAPPSKALTHRALIAGLLSNGITELVNPLHCDDTHATSNAVRALGAKVDFETGKWNVLSRGVISAPQNPVDCGQSGVTLRFLLPIASVTGERVMLRANETLIRRPLKALQDALKQLGVDVVVDGHNVIVDGSPKGGVVSIRGDVSSQFISGLLLAGSVMEDGLDLQLTTPLESKNYVALTLEVMKQHGILSESNPEMTQIRIRSGQRYSPFKHVVHGDYSSAAFLLAAAAVTQSEVLVHDLLESQGEPDAVLLQILTHMGATVRFLDDAVILEGTDLKGVQADVHDCPDLGPILAVLGCYADGDTTIMEASRLRYKESDRLEAITVELSALGVEISEKTDRLIVRGPCSPRGGVVQSHNDHRIAMALSVAALGADGDVTIKNAECVSKSYPNFFHDLKSLGVSVIER